MGKFRDLVKYGFLLGGSGSGGTGGGSGGSDGFPIGDGNTHIWIHLEEGRTSPMLGVCPNGTVTVDWGDGTEPDILTGTATNIVKFTPNHNYAKSGDYVITLTVDGEMGINDFFFKLTENTSDARNQAYYSAVKKIEIADGVTFIMSYAFTNCYSLSSIIISDSVKTIGMLAFRYCYSLESITIPNSVKNLGTSLFSDCHSLSSVTIPDGAKTIGDSLFYNCWCLSSIAIPNSVTSIGSMAFRSCYSLSSITIPSGVTSIGSSAFYECKAVRYYDFTNSAAVPSLSNTSAFTKIASDCEIRVPAALVDEWKAATNWATYADYIVGV